MSSCLFNFYVEYIMWNAGLDEAQASIKIARRHINNLRYAGDTTLIAESEEELKNLLMRVKEGSEKACLKFNIKKTKIMASGLITSWQRDGGKMETLTDYFLGLQNHCGWWTATMKLKDAFSLKKSCNKPRQHIKKLRHHVVNKVCITWVAWSCLILQCHGL